MTINYKRHYEESISILIDFFDSAYKDKTYLEPAIKQIIITKAFEYSYLFKDSYIRTIPQKTSFQLYELIYKLLKSNYKATNTLSLLFPVEIISKDRTENYIFTDPMNFTYRYYYKFTIQRSAYGNIGLKIKLKDEINSGAFFRLSMGYSLFQSSATTFSDTTIFSGDRGIAGLYFEGDYIISNPRDIKTFAFTSEFTIPVFYFTKNFFIEAGFHYTYQKIQFDFDFTKPGILEQPFSDDPQPFFDDKVVHVNKSYHLLRPVVSLNYSVIEQITLRMDYIFPENIRLGIRLGYLF